jgi:type I restriction enzyme S subunit
MIPAGWKFDRVDEFFVLQRGFDLTKAQSKPGTVPVVSSSGIGYFHNEAKVPAPGVVTGRKGSVGPVYYMETPFWPHDTSLWVKDFRGNYPKFVWYFLQAMQLEKLDEASSVPTLNRNNVHRCRVLFPPANEQSRIIKIVETWDRAIETMDALIANASIQKSALMQSLLTGKRRLPGFSGQWVEKSLDTVFHFLKGQGLSKDSVISDGRFPCILYGELYTRYTEVIGEVVGRTNANDGALSHAGDVLIPASTTTTGIDLANATALLESGVRLSGDINILRPKDAAQSAPFFAYLLTHIKKLEIASRAQGSTIVHLYGSALKPLFVRIPEPDEQHAIAAIVMDADKNVAALQSQLTALRQEKSSLMQQLLTGKRRVKIAGEAA